MEKRITFVAFVLAAMFIASVASAAPFQNGDFESYTNWNGGAWGSEYAPDGITGWTAFGRDGNGNPYGVLNVNWGSYTMYGSSPPNYNAIMLRWVYPGGIEQTFDTIAGNQYRVDFVMGGEKDGSTPIRDMRVTAGNVIQDFAFDTTDKYPWAMGWEEKSLVFTAAGAQSTLRFENIGAFEWCANAAIIDCVSVTDMGVVPEPASMIVLGMGLAGLIARRRK